MTSPAFFLATSDHPIDAGHAMWQRPLPGNRSGKPDPAGSVSYGQYFESVARFCNGVGKQGILAAASAKLARRLDAAELGSVSIFLEKHGACYHPARLQVAVGAQLVSLVVNVAVSGHGRHIMPDELRTLTQLNETRPFGWLPRIYAAADDDLPMFMGDWFADFHEFHLTRAPGSDILKIVIWDGAAAPRYLSDGQTADLYRTMAMILTACYDPVTTCQIFPWHHAAGDFILRIDCERTAVKLITARNYASLDGFDGQAMDERGVMDGLVSFLIQLSIRMRLDRLDGVSEVAWAPDGCLPPMVEGFFQGLDLTARLSGFPESFPDLLRGYWHHQRLDEVMAVARRIMETQFSATTEEGGVVRSRLDEHIRALATLLAA
jgi:hypothetical protein